LTRNIVPRANEEGQIGRDDKHWLKGWFKDMYVGQYLTDGTNQVTIADLMEMAPQSYWASSDGVSSTTSTSWQQKVLLNLNSIDAGDYLILWNCQISCSDTGVKLQLRIRINDSTTIADPQDELTGRFKYSNGINLSQCGFDVVTFGVGSHIVDLDYCSGTWGKTMYIMKARLLAMKVGD
jgi:hypothetical protein